MSTSTEPNLQQRAADGMRMALGVGGLIAVVVGALIVFYPAVSGAIAMAVGAAILAAYTLVVGAVYLGSAVFTKALTGWARAGNIVLGLLYLIAGIVLIANLGATAAFLAVFLSVLIGIMWIIEGVLAFTAIGHARSKAWTIIYGAVSIIAGAVLLLSPLLAAVTLWLLLGISMLVMGVVQVVRALSYRTH